MSSKAVQPHRSQAMRAFVRRIVAEEFEGNVTRAAKALRVPQSQLSDLLNDRGRGLGLVAVERVADYAGTTLDEVIGRAPVRTGGIQSLRAHPRWAEVEAAARVQHPEVEPRYFEQAGGLAFAGAPPARLDVPFVAGLARELRALDERSRATASSASRDSPPGK